MITNLLMALVAFIIIAGIILADFDRNRPLLEEDLEARIKQSKEAVRPLLLEQLKEAAKTHETITNGVFQQCLERARTQALDQERSRLKKRQNKLIGLFSKEQA